MNAEFKPTAEKSTWILRQNLMAQVRQFFVDRHVLEVETPLLSNAVGTDPELDYFETTSNEFLMTSPEFHMKRLLASGFGDIFQITKSFRKDEFGAHHNSEFSMVEWYRVGMPQENLMDEVEDLVSKILGKKIKALRTRWIDAFVQYATVHPYTGNLKDFEEVCEKFEIPIPENPESLSRENWWDYLMVFVIEPALAKNGAEFIYDYPPSQAALAQTYQDKDGFFWAKRFELFIDNIELCNGYTELTDYKEQRARFIKDIEIRKELNRKIPTIDENFLSALEAGMPSCSGVALGLDRLFMLALKKENIEDVILFPTPRA